MKVCENATNGQIYLIFSKNILSATLNLLTCPYVMLQLQFKFGIVEIWNLWNEYNISISIFAYIYKSAWPSSKIDHNAPTVIHFTIDSQDILSNH